MFASTFPGNAKPDTIRQKMSMLTLMFDVAYTTESWIFSVPVVVHWLDKNYHLPAQKRQE